MYVFRYVVPKPATEPLVLENAGLNKLDLNVSPVLAKKELEKVEKKVRKEYHIERNMNLRGKRPIWGKGDIIHRSK